MAYINNQPGLFVGYEKITVDDSQPFGLTPPKGAYSAIVAIDTPDPAQVDSVLILRFLENGAAFAGDDGLPLGKGGYYISEGPINMANFRMKGVEAGLSHIVKVAYYGFDK